MYEQLQSEAASLNIEVQERKMRNRIKGLYGDNVIWINKNISSSVEKACVLAEEIGHHFMTVGNIIDQSLISNVKQEKLARKWSYNKLVPLHSFLNAYKDGCYSRFEIAEYLNVTESFLEESLKWYQDKYGTRVRINNKYVLSLSPLRVFEYIQ